MKEIEVNHITKAFGKRIVLDDVSISVQKGQVIGLVGANGSGKTMLMRCICGFVIPETGKIYVQGKQIGKDTDFAPSTGILIEAPGFLPIYSGLTNLSILLSYSQKKNFEKLSDVMRCVGLDPHDKRLLRKYSMGMRQRLGIAQAIMDDPQILILDEPFNSLDQNGVKEVHQLLMDLKKRGKTMILASHNPQDINLLCDSVYEMEAGKVTRTITVEQIR